MRLKHFDGPAIGLNISGDFDGVKNGSMSSEPWLKSLSIFGVPPHDNIAFDRTPIECVHCQHSLGNTFVSNKHRPHAFLRYDITGTDVVVGIPSIEGVAYAVVAILGLARRLDSVCIWNFNQDRCASGRLHVDELYTDEVIELPARIVVNNMFDIQIDWVPEYDRMRHPLDDQWDHAARLWL